MDTTNLQMCNRLEAGPAVISPRNKAGDQVMESCLTPAGPMGRLEPLERAASMFPELSDGVPLAKLRSPTLSLLLPDSAMDELSSQQQPPANHSRSQQLPSMMSSPTGSDLISSSGHVSGHVFSTHVFSTPPSSPGSEPLLSPTQSTCEPEQRVRRASILDRMRESESAMISHELDKILEVKSSLA